MEKNMIWALVLSAGFMLLWYHFFPPASAQKALPPAAVSSGNPGVRDEPKPESREPAKNPEKVTESVLESEHLRLVLNSKGAAVRHWLIKDEKGWVDLVIPPPAGAQPEGAVWPLASFADQNFAEVRGSLRGQEKTESVWKAVLPSGAEAVKAIRIDSPQTGEGPKPRYFVTVALTLRNPTRGTITVPPVEFPWTGGLGTVESELKENQSVTRVLAYPSEKMEVEKFKTGEFAQKYRWVGLDNRYYLAAFLPQGSDWTRIQAEKTKQTAVVKLSTDPLPLKPGEVRALTVRIYAGPKGYTSLKQWGLKLEHAVDFGYFGFLGKWALKAMYFLHRVTGNYGWAIIILTCGLQVIVLPLSLKSYKSAAAMKRIQPQVKQVQDRYKGDAKRMNEELLKLYRESGTNPFGACLPMILQIPVFWAFFTMLRNAYELRGEPWLGWIRDLSQRDPYYVLPIVMGGGMFLQQKLQGSAGADPAQAKMMMFMPVIFTFMFLKFPSGLVLYWLTNSILSITIQVWFTRKYSAPPLSPAPA